MSGPSDRRCTPDLGSRTDPRKPRARGQPAEARRQCNSTSFSIMAALAFRRHPLFTVLDRSAGHPAGQGFREQKQMRHAPCFAGTTCESANTAMFSPPISPNRLTVPSETSRKGGGSHRTRFAVPEHFRTASAFRQELYDKSSAALASVPASRAENRPVSRICPGCDTILECIGNAVGENDTQLLRTARGRNPPSGRSFEIPRPKLVAHRK